MEIFNTKADIICVAGKANTGDVCQGRSSWYASLVVLEQMPSCEHTSAVISGRVDLQTVTIYSEQALFSAECLGICADSKVVLGWLERIIAKFDLYVWQCGLRWNCQRACISAKQV